MKKIISLLLVLVMVLGMFAGCGNNAATEPSSTPETTAPAEVNYANSTVILYTGNVRGDVQVYSQIAAAKAAYEEKGATVYLVDAGNYLQGTAYANSDRGLTVYNLMDAAGYDVAAMGMYEFVYGEATTGYIYHSNLYKYFTQAELYKGAEALEYQKNAPWAEEAVMDNRAAKKPATFAVICSNLTAGEEATGYYAFESNTVLGETLKVGFVAAADENVADSLQDGFLTGYTFGEVAAPACDVLVALGGGTGDIVIEAPADGELVVGAYVIDNATKAVTSETVDMTGADADVDAAIAAAATSPVVFTSEVTLDGSDRANWNGQTNLGTLTANALLWYAENKVEGLKDVPVVAIQNGGNCDNYIYAGDVTEVDLLRALPFSPMGVGIVYVTGAELLETLEAATQSENCPGWAQVAGLEYTVDTSAAYDAGEAYGDFFKAASIKRVTINSVSGAAFDENATYAVIGDNFLMNGNDTYYTFGAIKETGENYVEVSTFGGLKTRDIVALYVQEVLGGTVTENTKASASAEFTLSNSILGEEYEFTYTGVPQKVVSLASPATEMLLALGLEKNIAGYAFQENVIPEKYQAAFNSLYQITDGWDLSLEQIMAMEPDFMMFWNGSPDYTYEFLSTNDISTYTMTSDIDGAKIQSVYDDFTNMGKIFGVEERAAQIIAEMKAKIDPVKEAMANVDPVSVVYIDAYSSEEAAFTAGDALVADIFRTAGGENIINDTTDPWLNVSWEKIAAANPQWIVIGVYEGAEDADYWIDFLKNNPATATMDAVKNENFIITGLVDLTVGERIADTVPMLAGYFHP